MASRYRSRICERLHIYVIVSSISLALLLITLLVYPQLEPGSHERAISQLNIIVLSGVVITASIVFYVCRDEE